MVHMRVGGLMFNRQWFSKESQIGLTESAIQFEWHLSQLDILKCIDVLRSQDLSKAYWQRQKKKTPTHYTTNQNFGKGL